MAIYVRALDDRLSADEDFGKGTCDVVCGAFTEIFGFPMQALRSRSIMLVGFDPDKALDTVSASTMFVLRVPGWKHASGFIILSHYAAGLKVVGDAIAGDGWIPSSLGSHKPEFDKAVVLFSDLRKFADLGLIEMEPVVFSFSVNRNAMNPYQVSGERNLQFPDEYDVPAVRLRSPRYGDCEVLLSLFVAGADTCVIMGGDIGDLVVASKEDLFRRRRWRPDNESWKDLKGHHLRTTRTCIPDLYSTPLVQGRDDFFSYILVLYLMGSLFDVIADIRNNPQELVNIGSYILREAKAGRKV